MLKIKTPSNQQAKKVVLVCSSLAMFIAIFWFFFGTTTDTLALSSIAAICSIKLLKGFGIIDKKDTRSKPVTIVLILILAAVLVKELLPLL
ncbi:MAG: hypothetical protein ACJAXJ_001598 [Colwellia sp.]|jgi:hypothetical protein